MKILHYSLLILALLFGLILVTLNVATWQQLQAKQLEILLRPLLINVLLLVAILFCIAWPMYWRQRILIKKINQSVNLLQQQKQAVTDGFSVLSSVFEDLGQEKERAVKGMLANAQLATIVNNADDAIISFSVSGTLLTANNTARRLMPFTSNDSAPSVRDLFDESSRSVVEEMIAETQKNGERKVGEIALASNTGHRDFSISISPVIDSDGVANGFAMTLRDVTDEKRVADRFRTAVNAAPNAMLMINCDGKIVLSNAEAEVLFGYSSEELEGNAIEMLIPMELRHSHRDYRWQFLRDPERRSMGVGRELYAQRRDGTRVAVEIGLTPVQMNDGQYVISSIVNITDRKKYQTELEELNLELEEKHAEMEQFIYTVSHDLKAPLVTIGGFSKRLQEKLEKNLGEREQRYLERIIANVKLMEDLLNDLLMLSRVIKQNVEIDWVNLNDLLTELVGSLDNIIAEKSGTITLPNTAFRVWANDRLLRQCLQNLLTNALNHCKPDVSPLVAIDCVDAEHEVRISIRDNGIGIDKKYYQRIFDIFERLNMQNNGGTGVGLSIVKAVCDKHGGEVILDSEIGVGSTFTVVFPKPIQR